VSGRATELERQCLCTEEDSSDGSATHEDNPYCPIHGIVADLRDLQAENAKLLEDLRLLHAIREWVEGVKRAAEADPSGKISCDALIEGSTKVLEAWRVHRERCSESAEIRRQREDFHRRLA
jgi:hypothetical protein